jgi:pectin methylesterase-like acyl-CoA thioesterase
MLMESLAFRTVSAALASLTGTTPATIFIFPGTYNEQVIISHPSVMLMGSTTEYAVNAVIWRLIDVMQHGNVQGKHSHHHPQLERAR